MKKSSRSLLIIGLLVFVVGALIPVSSFAADVNVYAEGAYTESYLVVYIYADINSTTELRSAGVKLTYETAALTVDTAEKNESVWFLGSESYMDPDTTTAGEVVIILGKLDTGDATAGVSGDRVLLGKVRFNRTGSSMPFSPTIGLDYGKRGPEGKFKNFVETDQTELDDTGVNFGTITIAERGDANADGSVTPADMIAVRNAYYGGAHLGCEPAADCNDDSSNLYPNVTPADMICIRNKYYSSP